jgi:hypothetical protein
MTDQITAEKVIAAFTRRSAREFEGTPIVRPILLGKRFESYGSDKCRDSSPHKCDQITEMRDSKPRRLDRLSIEKARILRRERVMEVGSYWAATL